ncbi:MAG: hypothetical protein ACR2JB_09040, partial [Bryobacteraceae bacterium]
SISVAFFCLVFAVPPFFPPPLLAVAPPPPPSAPTALGIVITCGWIGLAVSSPIIGALAENQNYRHGLMLLPFFSLLMVLVNLALRPVLKRHVVA